MFINFIDFLIFIYFNKNIINFFIKNVIKYNSTLIFTNSVILAFRCHHKNDLLIYIDTKLII